MPRLSHLCDGPAHTFRLSLRRTSAGGSSPFWAIVPGVVKPALRTVGNIVCAEDDMDYTQHVVDRNTVPCLRKLINHSNREIQKEACWTLSNIAAGTQPQIQCVLESGAVEPLVEIARSPTSDSDVKIEACWVLLNATSCGSNSQIQYLVEKGCVQVLCDLLGETTMVMMALEGIEKILQVGEDIAKKSKEKIANPYAAIVDSSELERLQSHQSKAIANRARRMWKQHYVTCAICKKNYSVCSPITKWCSECKSTVCGNCDCTKFHLSYQLALWGEEDTNAEREG